MSIAVISSSQEIEMPYITVPEAAELTGYTESYVGRLARQNKIKARRFGPIWQIDQDDILKYKQDMEKLGPSKFGIRYEPDEPATD